MIKAQKCHGKHTEDLVRKWETGKTEIFEYQALNSYHFSKKN